MCGGLTAYPGCTYLLLGDDVDVFSPPIECHIGVHSTAGVNQHALILRRFLPRLDDHLIATVSAAKSITMERENQKTRKPEHQSAIIHIFAAVYKHL